MAEEPPDASVTKRAVPMPMRIVALLLRAVFLGALIVVAIRVSAPQSASAPARLAAAPAVAPVERPTSAAIASWERLLVAQLERHKRYPPQAGGKVGEARLAFDIDRTGRVLASRIVHSSGSDALDREALALLRRAAPLPPPPAGLPDDRLSFVVPIRYH